jgi:DNA-binding response OmpR family regulator
LRVLLVEDDPMIGKGLQKALREAAMSVDWARTGAAGLEAMAVGSYAIALLDLGLPGMDGLDILRSARASGNQTPVLVITARDDLANRVSGLDLGADDYVVKPFAISELLARIRAVLRRQGTRGPSTLGNGAIELDLGSREASYGGKKQVLSAREFALLRALLESAGSILSRAQLEERIYGWGEEVESNAIDVLIHYLRKRFDKEIIRNVRGAGWMIPKDRV